MSERAPRKMWGGRFREPLDPDILEYTSSFAVDRRLLRWDLAASVAHGKMLGTTGIIPAAEAQLVVDGLRRIAADAAAGRLEAAGAYEDVHSFIEATLYERIGAAAGRLHTARSRNDQVATAFRLWVKHETAALVGLIADLLVLTIDRAGGTVDIILPGFTHLQHAQPVRLAHHLLGYAAMLERDADRLMSAYRRADVLPLGSGALAGVSFPVDRDQVADALGFSRISANSIDATGDRDFAVEAIFGVALLMTHLSRWGEEIVLWATDEFGFVRLTDPVSTGSSIMPQKQNPDPAELIRARSGRAVGNLGAMLATLKGLTAGYHRDLQEDKGLVFESMDVGSSSVRAMRRLLEGIEFIGPRMAAAAARGLLTATEVADYLVRKGVPFREAHELTGRVVTEALDRGVQLWDLPLDVYRSISPLFEHDVLQAVTLEEAVEAKRTPGGTGRNSVNVQLESARNSIAAIRAWVRQAESVMSRVESLLRG